ncbi:MFS transporter [Nonomuraea antimicrobica]
MRAVAEHRVPHRGPRVAGHRRGAAHPGSLAIIQASFVRHDRPRAVGVWSGLGGVASAIGPLLGGWLVQTAGWRWAFLINLPFAALIVFVTLRHVPESRDETAAGRFDVLGSVLAALALAGITYGLIEQGRRRRWWWGWRWAWRSWWCSGAGRLTRWCRWACSATTCSRR